ncbi:hypothetical protein QQF64_029437 [Cirrhinus molitorella]|uniref:Taste receptor type 1 member 1 n=1 Tax=Cirrhinus molitorella TaxID=172907 RepID=A0ABR3N0U1_9TELE
MRLPAKNLVSLVWTESGQRDWTAVPMILWDGVIYMPLSAPLTGTLAGSTSAANDGACGTAANGRHRDLAASQLKTCRPSDSAAFPPSVPGNFSTFGPFISDQPSLGSRSVKERDSERDSGNKFACASCTGRQTNSIPYNLTHAACLCCPRAALLTPLKSGKSQRERSNQPNCTIKEALAEALTCPWAPIVYPLIVRFHSVKERSLAQAPVASRAFETLWVSGKLCGAGRRLRLTAFG